MRQFYFEMRAWIGPVAVGLAFVSMAGLGLMQVEAAYSPTCMFSQCDGAHVPGPFFLFWMFATVTGYYLSVAALLVACIEGVSVLRRPRSPRGRLFLVAAGPAAVVATWLANAGFQWEPAPLFEWAASLIGIVVLVPLVILGTSYMWVGGIAAGAVMLLRREGPAFVACGITAYSLLAGVYGVWVVRFNDGAFF